MHPTDLKQRTHKKWRNPINLFFIIEALKHPAGKGTNPWISPIFGSLELHQMAQVACLHLMEDGNVASDDTMVESELAADPESRVFDMKVPLV